MMKKRIDIDKYIDHEMKTIGICLKQVGQSFVSLGKVNRTSKDDPILANDLRTDAKSAELLEQRVERQIGNRFSVGRALRTADNDSNERKEK